MKTVHHIATGYIALLMLLKILAVPVICLQYVVNKEYIIENLCENRFRPAMHCDGKCLLSKHLAKATDTSDSQNQKGSSRMVSTDYFEGIRTYSFTCTATTRYVFPVYQVSSYATGYTGNIFQPPITVA